MLWASQNGGWTVINKMVTDGKICLIPANIYKFNSYLVMEDDFGVLPIPKFDETQEEYYHQVFTNACCALCIPNNIENTEMVGMVTEYLAYLGQEKMVPAYYDSYLQGRVARDTQSELAFNIIFSTKRYDLGYAFNWNGINSIIKDAVVQNGGIASLLDQKVDGAQIDADETYDAFINALE